MTEQEERALRRLLRGRQIICPAMLFGLLGGDPNRFPVEAQVLVIGWLHALGYRRMARPHFTHAHLMTAWWRDEVWPGDELGVTRLYYGIPLKPDPDLADSRRAQRSARRRFDHRLSRLGTGRSS